MTNQFFPANYKAPTLESLLSSISSNVDKVLDTLESYREVITELDIDDEVTELTERFTLDFVNDSVRDIILENFYQACVKTKEYNYDLFIDKFTSALDTNLNDIYTVSHLYGFSVTLNMDILGTARDWGNAVSKVREVLKTRTQADIASVMWREKIYGAGREGKKVFRRRKIKKEKGEGLLKLVGKGSSEPTSEYEMVDVTEKYVGKYRDTIQDRMEAMDSFAPFWEIIDQGNAISLPSDRGGKPYPAFPATNFVDKSERQIKGLYDGAYDYYEDLIGRKLQQIFEEESNWEWEWREEIGELDISYRAEPEIVRDVFEGTAPGATGRDVADRLDDELGVRVVKRVSTTGKVYNQYRDLNTGQFIPKPR